MTFLRNKTKYMNQTKPNSKIKYIGSLPTISFDSSAVEFHSNPIINSINYSERPYLYTSKLSANTLKGSLTIEASIGIPLYLIIVSVLLSIFPSL